MRALLVCFNWELVRHSLQTAIGASLNCENISNDLLCGFVEKAFVVSGTLGCPLM